MSEIQKVRYEKNENIGDCRKTESIEGTVDDVLKILEKTEPREVTNNITINVASEQNINDVVETMKQHLEKGIIHG